MSETAENLVDSNNIRNCSLVIERYRKYSLINLLLYCAWTTRIIVLGKPPLHDTAKFSDMTLLKPVEEVERRPTRVEKGVKDFFKEEWVDRVS